MLLFECRSCKALLLTEDPKQTVEVPRCPVRSCTGDLMEMVTAQDEDILALARFVLTVSKPTRVVS